MALFVCLTACRGREASNACSAYAASYERHKTCWPDSGVRLASFSVTACEIAIAAAPCGWRDRGFLQKHWDCLAKAKPCRPGDWHAPEFDDMFCALPLWEELPDGGLMSRISPGCLSAIESALATNLAGRSEG